ncbi:BrnA antitoxin family protein [Roseospira navarrensis]|uniref:BrnA antitoxin family protein n=1 Tax=Roseospira navarrensis TaxID=140058 RepID=A0A7X2D2Q0_9PROT|nr:BrnA antitoxin family protein [Roseospira navarrensis]MQX36023.1 hypothetical protein [Roseospira navarrensis]
MRNHDTLPDRLQRELDALDRMPDADIDTTDVPEVAEGSAGRRGVFYRPVKRQVTIRLDADVLDWFQASGRRHYQTRINAALRSYIDAHSE